ncbi:hypothetical protein EYC80_002713 [Monilinia laxa]|uniref:Methyltransferase type 12 domain-containing protein n=1 Tax=Monilinia laxa TaxID=61186 RepID=A0A5N6K4R3_MONLA|nr:hypothetical protein EYC80_002713 [Monilinia laxa]
MQLSPQTPVDSLTSVISAHYNRRAQTYDNATTFHKSLARAYVKYVKPILGEKALDLACGTGMVGFALNSENSLSRLHGIDISPGMLEIARLKTSEAINLESKQMAPSLPLEHSRLPIIRFDHHDITYLSTLSSLSDSKGEFDIITICSSFILLPSPLKNLRSWIPYLKDSSSSPSPIPIELSSVPPHQTRLHNKFGGRLILDIPHPSSMLGLSVFSKLSPEFGIPVLGSRNWIGMSELEGMKNLERLMREAGLVEVEVFETDIFPDIPAATPWGDRTGMNIGGREVKGRREWPATIEVGEMIFEVMTVGGNMERWREGGDEGKKRRRERWAEEWVKLGVRYEGEEIVVREEGRLIIGIGFKG